MSERDIFAEENNELLRFILENRFFKVWRDPSSQADPHSLWKDANVELFITSACNLKCEYCYLQRHGDGLYPKEYRDKDNILKNMRILFDWFLDEGFAINDLDLFSGEIWHTPFGFEVLDIVIDYIKRGLTFKRVVIPTNCTFLLDNNTMFKMQDYIDEFDSLGTRLMISCSIDGAVLESETRSLKDEDKNPVRDNGFYEKLFAFAKKNNYLFHPMVASANVDKWIENLKWYTQQIRNYHIDAANPIMMLEVRNGDWTDESIQRLLEFYDYEIEQKLKACQNDVKVFSEFLLGKNGDNNGYVNYALPIAENQPGCSVSTHLCIRLGDLAICPCHRTAYDRLLYGKFDITNGRITGITAINPQMAIRVLGGNNKIDHHGCDTCPYNGLCMRGCYGAQYEYAQDAFMPVENVCNMFKTKYNHLIDKYDSMGVIDYWRNMSEYDIYYDYAQRLVREIDKIQTYRKGGKIYG